MIKAVKLLSLLILLLLLSTYYPTYKIRNTNLIFTIKNVEIENNKVLDSNEIVNELAILNGKSLLLVDREIIKSAMNKFDFISSFQIKKVYPQTIKIRIFEEEPIAIYFDGANKFYASDKGKFINYITLENYKDLPLLFGGSEYFFDFYKSLKEINFPISDIKSFHYFEIGRWDIILNDEKIIKLPKEN